MRVLYVLAFVMMTTKFVTMNALVKETERGKARQRETQDQSVFAVLRESPAILRQLLRAPETLYAGALLLLLGIGWVVRDTFLSIYITQRLAIPDEELAYYTFARSVTMLLFFFLAMPRLRRVDERRLLFLSIVGLVASHVLLIVTPAGSRGLLLLVTVLEGCALPLLSALLGKISVVNVDAAERARIMALLNATVLLFTSPFGWIAGRLSILDRRWPFVLVTGLFALAAALVVWGARAPKGKPELQPG